MTGAGLPEVLADRLPELLAPVLGPGLSVGRVEPLSGGASRQTWGVQVHGGDGRSSELVLRTGRPGEPGSEHSGRPVGGVHAGLELEAAAQRAAAAAGMPVPSDPLRQRRRERPRLPVPDQRPGSR